MSTCAPLRDLGQSVGREEFRGEGGTDKYVQEVIFIRVCLFLPLPPSLSSISVFCFFKARLRPLDTSHFRSNILDLWVFPDYERILAGREWFSPHKDTHEWLYGFNYTWEGTIVPTKKPNKTYPPHPSNVKAVQLDRNVVVTLVGTSSRWLCNQFQIVTFGRRDLRRLLNQGYVNKFTGRRLDEARAVWQMHAPSYGANLCEGLAVRDRIPKGVQIVSCSTPCQYSPCTWIA